MNPHNLRIILLSNVLYFFSPISSKGATLFHQIHTLKKKHLHIEHNNSISETELNNTIFVYREVFSMN